MPIRLQMQFQFEIYWSEFLSFPALEHNKSRPIASHDQLNL